MGYYTVFDMENLRMGFTPNAQSTKSELLAAVAVPSVFVDDWMDLTLIGKVLPLLLGWLWVLGAHALLYCLVIAKDNKIDSTDNEIE